MDMSDVVGILLVMAIILLICFMPVKMYCYAATYELDHKLLGVYNVTGALEHRFVEYDGRMVEARCYVKPLPKRDG